MSSLLDESAVQTKLGELSNKITAFKAQLDESNEVKMMLEQQLESSTSQCTALQEELNAKIDDEHEFEEKITLTDDKCMNLYGISLHNRSGLFVFLPVGFLF